MLKTEGVTLSITINEMEIVAGNFAQDKRRTHSRLLKNLYPLTCMIGKKIYYKMSNIAKQESSVQAVKLICLYNTTLIIYFHVERACIKDLKILA